MTDPKPAGKPSGARLLVGLCVVGAIGGGLYLATNWRETETAAVEVADPVPKPVLESAQETPEPDAAADEELAALTPETPVESPDAEDETDAAEVEAAPEPSSEPTREPVTPSLDVVRVAPDGGALVAGRAEPGARVTVRADDDALAEVEADAEGNFVAIFEAEPSRDPRALTLEAEADGETQKSEDVVVLLPSATPEEPAAEESLETEVAETETEAEVAEAEVAAAESGAGADPALAETETEDSEAPVEEVAEVDAATDDEPQVAATAVIRDGVIEVQPLARPTGTDEDEVSIASISYADAGEVQLAGFGLAGSTLRAYVDDEFTQEGFVDASGQWSIDLGDVEVGVYRLRVDQIDEAGTVASRIETPFKRDVPRARPEGAPDDAVSVIVQPGNNLWTLARIHYGSGVQYTQIFNANSDLIRDPDLIYPGQILGLPESETN